MKKVLLAAILALPLGGCFEFLKPLELATEATVPTAAVVTVVSTFDALESTATQYLSLPKCTGSNGPLCRSPAITRIIIPAVRSGRIARTNLEAYLTNNPGRLGPRGLYNALTSAVATLQGVAAQYQ